MFFKVKVLSNSGKILPMFRGVIILLLWASAVFGGIAIPLNLDNLIKQSDKIFVGRCLEASPELDQRGFPSLWCRFQVTHPVRGVAEGESVLIKQFGAGQKGGCQEGEEALLFLYPESEYGFTSAIGLGQGRFVIQTDSNGLKVVLTPFAHLRREIGDLDLESLLRDLRRRVSHGED